MNPNTLNEALKRLPISSKESFETLSYAIVLNKFNKVAQSDEDLLISKYTDTPEALIEYTEDMIASNDIQTLSQALKLMQKEIIKLREEKNTLKAKNKSYLDKCET
jgi:hypothetical protein